MKVEAMVFRFSNPSSSALTSPSAGDTAQRGQATAPAQHSPEPPWALCHIQHGGGAGEGVHGLLALWPLPPTLWGWGLLGFVGKRVSAKR